MQIAQDAIVTIEYELSDPDGRVLDSSRESGPLTYIHGHGRIVPGLEAALAGYEAGDELRITVAPESAYGWHDPGRVEWLPKTALDAGGNVEVGAHFEARTAQGIVVATVVAIDGPNAQVDANHPLAGVELHFTVKVLSVRAATRTEIMLDSGA